MKKTTVCLNMIVKNEAHIIHELLENICKYQCIDCYAINDTGSTDGTQQVIKEFFDAKGITGEIVDHNFLTCTCHTNKLYKIYDEFHFGWNRTFALNMCKGKADYIFVMDADDLVKGNPDFSNLIYGKYEFELGGEGCRYVRPLLFKNDPNFKWKFKDPVHEYLSHAENVNMTTDLMTSCSIESRRLGDRSKTTEKFARDARSLEKWIKLKPHKPRSYFYCAQSYFDDKNYEKAIEMYTKRSKMGDFYEEVYNSLYKIAKAKECLGAHPKKIIDAYKDAAKHSPDMAEPLYEIALIYYKENKLNEAYKYALNASSIKFPEHRRLFPIPWIYKYGISKLLIKITYKLGKYISCAPLLNTLLKHDEYFLNDNEYKKYFDQLEECKNKLRFQYKKNIVVYLDNIIPNQNLKNLIESLSIKYKVICVGNKIFNLNDVLFISPNKYKLLTNIDPVCLIVYNNINYFFDKTVNLDAKYNILCMESNQFEIVSNYVNFVVNDNKLINTKIMSRINKLLFIDTTIKKEFAEKYHLDNNDLDYFNPLIIDDLTTANNCLPIFKENNSNKLINHYDKTQYPFMPTLIQQNLKELLVKYDIKDSEIELKLIKIDDTNTNKQKIATLKKMLNNPEITNKYKIQKKIAKLYSACEEYTKSYNMAASILKNKDLTNIEREKIEYIQTRNIDFFADSYKTYPKLIVDNLTKQVAKNQPNNIILTITSCKRFDLFEKKVNSLLNSFNDINKIDQFLCIDDNSSSEDRQLMVSKYPFFKFIFKNINQKGHVKSMNMLREYVLANNYKYQIHLEDDFLFIQKRDYVSQAIEIIEENPMYGQVLFNRNSSEIEFCKIYIVGGIPHYTKNNLRYIEHEYVPSDTIEKQAFDKKYNHRSNCAYWPHFSFRPSLINTSIYKTLGEFYSGPHFEMRFAEEYVANGYKSTFFDEFCCVHIGKKTWEKTANSYTLNQTDQFTLSDSVLSIHVTSYNNNNNNNQNNWNRFKEMMNKNNLACTRHIPNIRIELNELEKQMFADIEYDRQLISKLMLRLNVILNNPNKNILLLNDNSILNCTIHDLLDFVKDKQFVKFPGNNYYISSASTIKLINAAVEHQIYDFNKLIGLCDFKIDTNDELILDNNENDNDNNEELNVEIKQSNCPPGYKFYSLMDSYGNDLCVVYNKTPQEIAEVCDYVGGVGFNSLGYIKCKINNHKDLITLPKSYNHAVDGLYIKL